MAIEDAVTLAELIGTNNDLDQVLHSFEAARRPRVDTYAPGSPSYRCQRFRGARHTRAVGATSTGFSDSLKAYDDLIEDPFALPRPIDA